MAQIREELILYDKFTDTFTKYLRYGEQAAGVTKEAQRTAKEYGQSQREAAAATDGLTSSIRNLVGGYISLQGLRSLLDLSDTITATTARLNMMNDGLQTTAELNQMIWQSAQRSRGAYAETANLVAQLGNLAGDAFGSSAEIVEFAEQINKQIALSGASSQAASAAILQLTQALSSGTLRGDELNSILEQAPTIARAISDYLGVSTGEMRELASEGAVTAEVVKNAMFAAAEETNAKFESMPMTWAQVWTSMQNTAINALEPVLNGVSFLANNLEIIKPLALGTGVAFAVFLTAANWVKITTAATTALSSAQAALSVVMATAWGPPLIAVILVMTAIYTLTAVVNRFAGTSISATGLVTGAFWTMAAALANIVILLMNGFADLGNFIGNVFNDPVAAIKALFWDMASSVLGLISNVAHGIESLVNVIPGVQVSITGGIDSLYSNVKAAAQTARSGSEWVEYFAHRDYADLTDSFHSAYNWGAELFSTGETAGFGSMLGYVPYDQLSGVTDQLENIAGGVENIEKTVGMSDEDLKSLVDVAERRYVSQVNLTAQTPVITVNGANTGRTAADRQNLANAIRDILIEQAASGSVRSTARPAGG